MEDANANLNGQYNCEASSDRWVRTDGLRVIRQGKGVTCPPQWLPVLLASHQPAPPTRRRRRRLVDNVFTSTAGLRTAAKEYNTNQQNAIASPSPPSACIFTTKASLMTEVQAYNANPTAATAKCGPIADWDVSAITDMGQLFYNLKNFNADVSNWETSGVTTMREMFEVRNSPCPAPNLQSSLHCTRWTQSPPSAGPNAGPPPCAPLSALGKTPAFNQPLAFDTSSVTTMGAMFYVRSSPCPVPNL